MLRNESKECLSCGKKAHDFMNEEALSCIPPKNITQFGNYNIDEEYREALFKFCPQYNTEEVVGSYLGNNPHFLGESQWLEEKEQGLY